MTATGRVRRSRIRTGSSRIGTAAAISKGTGTRRAGTTITTTAGIVIASATGIGTGGSTETTTIAIGGSERFTHGAKTAWEAREARSTVHRRCAWERLTGAPGASVAPVTVIGAAIIAAAGFR